MASLIRSRVASHRFAATTGQLDNGAPVVSVVGEVDLATAPTLEQALLGAADDRTGEVVVDLTGCSFMDSRGLHVLVATREHLHRSDRPLALVMADPSLLRIFRIMEVENLFQIYPTLGALADRGVDGIVDG